MLVSRKYQMDSEESKLVSFTLMPLGSLWKYHRGEHSAVYRVLVHETTVNWRRKDNSTTTRRSVLLKREPPWFNRIKCICGDKLESGWEPLSYD